MNGDSVTAWAATEHETLRRGASHFWLGVGASAEVRRDLLALAPGRSVRVVLAIDRSSSMAGARLTAAKRAAQAVVEMMRDGDELGVIVFDATVAVIQPVAQVTPELRRGLHERLSSIEAGLGTALAEAAVRSLALASEGRIPGEGLALLLTDGFPFVGETRPAAIVQLVEASARAATLSTVAFGDQLDGPLLASMAQVGLGHFLHLGEDDEPAAALGGEIGAAIRAVTGRVELTVRLRGGVVLAHGGVLAERRQDGELTLRLPPLVAGEPAVVPLEVDLCTLLPGLPPQFGLATLRAQGIDGREIVLEVPLRVEVGDRLGAPDPRVVRARCLFEAGRVLRRVAVWDGDELTLARDLLDVAGRIEGRAAAAALDDDPPIVAVLATLRATADDLLHAREVSEVAVAAAALAIEQHYDPGIGTLSGGPLAKLRRPAQDGGSKVAIDLLSMVAPPSSPQR